MQGLKRQLLRRLPHGSLLVAQELVELYNRPIRRLARWSSRVPPLEKLDLRATRKSDTVFILGSGGSLGRISPARWGRIGACDSFGFNFTLRHPFVPTHYFFEPHRPPVFNQIIRFAKMRTQGYEAVCKIVLPGFPQSAWWEWRLHQLPAKWREGLYAGGVHRAFARNEQELAEEISRLARAGAFGLERRRIDSVLKHMGSVSSLVSVAAHMGYRDIVLCGIDITDPRYFYDDAEQYPDLVDYVKSFRKKFEHDKRPREAVQAAGDLVIMELQRQVLDPEGIKLWVECSSSGLHPRLDVAPPQVYGGGS